jgi:DNA polymerase V
MSPPIRFGLVDVNNFYCSCERVFQPKLEGKPLIILSNNDGCAVARSNEAKALGIRMAEPWHIAKQRPGMDQVIAMSSNYTLYADMSNRVMQILADLSPAIEVYSIDECFIRADGIRDLPAFGHQARDRIKQWTGLPVCAGFGSTKTRAKISNHVAKKRLQHGGVFNLEALSESQQNQLLGEIDVGEVWGIGRRLAPKLNESGIHTVRDLRDADPHRLRQQFSVVLQKTIAELRGVSCMPLELVAPTQKQIMCSRSFGREIETFEELREAMISYISRAAEKLRAQGLLAGGLMIFAHTNPFKEGAKQYHRNLTVPLSTATDDTRTLAGYAAAAAEAIWRPGYKFKKAGTMLTDLRPRSERQATLFDSVADQEKRARLNRAMDALNTKYGRDTVSIAAAGTGKRAWKMQRGNLSPAFTTNWDEIPVANRIMPPDDARNTAERGRRGSLASG